MFMNAYFTPAGVLSDASLKELLHMQISQWLIIFDGADVLTPHMDRLGSYVYLVLAGTSQPCTLQIGTLYKEQIITNYCKNVKQK